MTEIATKMQIEDSVASANTFLQSQRDSSLDGSFAADQITGRVVSVAERAAAFLRAVEYKNMPGLYGVIGQTNAAQYEEAVVTLPGYMVLVPSALADLGNRASQLLPAVVSEDGIKNNHLRLHVLMQPYRQQLRYGASLLLSAAGQSETAGIGEHGRRSDDGLEAEHFATLLTVGADPALQAGWQMGQHINHAWRTADSQSVSSQVSSRLFDSGMQQKTITISKAQVEAGKAMLFWHDGLTDAQTGKPEAATRSDALVVLQALGFEALRQREPSAVDNLKRLLA